DLRTVDAPASLAEPVAWTKAEDRHRDLNGGLPVRREEPAAPAPAHVLRRPSERGENLGTLLSRQCPPLRRRALQAIWRRPGGAVPKLDLTPPAIQGRDLHKPAGQSFAEINVILPIDCHSRLLSVVAG